MRTGQRWVALAAWAGAWTLFAGASSLLAQEPRPELDRGLLRQFSALGKSMDDQRWREESSSIERAVDNVWKRNGWSSEADRFARNLVCEMAAIPPWDPMRRLQVFNDRVATRYGLAGEPATKLQGMVMAEAAQFLGRHSGVIFGQMQDGLSQRVKGQPFTAEQVARWTEQSAPLLDDMRRTVERLAKEVEPMLDPTKAQVLQRDLQSFSKRKMYLDQMTTKWSQGQWQPIDWGLQDDPIQGGVAENVPPPVASPAGAGAGAVGPVVPPSTTPPVAAIDARGVPGRLPRVVAHDPPTWFAYVLEMQQRYQLDGGQMSTAESIHDELFDRAKRFVESHKVQLDPIAERDRTTHEAFEPIRGIFRELQHRLEAIPTTGQREQAEDRSPPRKPTPSAAEP